MENNKNKYAEYQYYEEDANGGVGAGVGDNYPCEIINIDTRSNHSNNSLASSSSSGSRPLKKRIITYSFVWKYFEKIKDSNGDEFVICKLKKNVNINNNETE